jgi:hypothetical protein
MGAAGLQAASAARWTEWRDHSSQTIVGDALPNKCHWTARRHGCSYYNYDCTTNPTCTLTNPLTTIIKTCTNAECRTGLETQTCKLKAINTTFNTCYITGDKNNLGCTGAQERCTLGIFRKWNEPNAAGGPINIEDTPSSQCSDDPSINPNDGTQRAVCTPLPVGTPPVNDPNTPG